MTVNQGENNKLYILPNVYFRFLLRKQTERFPITQGQIHPFPRSLQHKERKILRFHIKNIPREGNVE